MLKDVEVRHQELHIGLDILLQTEIGGRLRRISLPLSATESTTFITGRKEAGGIDFSQAKSFPLAVGLIPRQARERQLASMAITSGNHQTSRLLIISGETTGKPFKLVLGERLMGIEPSQVQVLGREAIVQTSVRQGSAIDIKVGPGRFTADIKVIR